MPVDCGDREANRHVGLRQLDPHTQLDYRIESQSIRLEAAWCTDGILCLDKRQSNPIHVRVHSIRHSSQC